MYFHKLLNGSVEVIPVTHKGPMYEHWHNGVYTGAVAQEIMDEKKLEAIPCYGVAGSACLMHSTLLHGSGHNLSDKARTLFICEYTAEDSYPSHPEQVHGRDCTWQIYFAYSL